MTDATLFSDISSNPMLWIWVVIIAGSIIAEIATLGLTTIWFAGGAAVALGTSIAGGSIWLQIILFIIVSVVLMILIRPYAKKRFNNRRVATNVDSILGQTGIVINEIDNLQSQGLVKIGGQEWTARSMDSSEKIAPGQEVIVDRVEGVKVIVRKKEGGE